MQTDPYTQAKNALAQARAALDAAELAIDTAQTMRRPASNRQPAGRLAAHRIAEAIAAETTNGLPLDDPLCRRIYIAAYETYTQTIANGGKPAKARAAAHMAVQEEIQL